MGEQRPARTTWPVRAKNQAASGWIALTLVAAAAMASSAAATPIRPPGMIASARTPIALPLARLGPAHDAYPLYPRLDATTLGTVAAPLRPFAELVPKLVDGDLHSAGGPFIDVAARAGSGWTSLSGLSWRSGQACYTRYDLERHRGRRHDVYVEFSGRSNFADVVRVVSNWHPRVYSQRPGRLSVGLPMLTNDMRFQWQRCLDGSLDRHFFDIGRALHSKGLGDAIIRLGWEANGSGFPWKIRENVNEYKACFQRQVRLLRSVAPGLQIDWTMRKATEGRQGAHMLYPGDEFVDIIGVNYYDWWPAARTQRDWDAAYSATYQGGPRGLGTWLTFARSRGKKLSVPEWGVAAVSGGGGDNPFYVQKMHETFRRNAASIEYEGYFNCGDRHRLYPTSILPRASAAYRQLWSGSY